MPGVIAMGVSLPSKDRWIGVWYGEVMSRVIIGGVVGKSSTMIAGMSARTMSHHPGAVRRVKGTHPVPPSLPCEPAHVGRGTAGGTES